MGYPAFIEWAQIASGSDKQADSVEQALGCLGSSSASDVIFACDEALRELDRCASLDARAAWSRATGRAAVQRVAEGCERASGTEPRVTGAAIIATWFLAAVEDRPDMNNHGSALLSHNPELMRDVAHTVDVIANGQLSVHIAEQKQGIGARVGEQLRKSWNEVRAKRPVRPACCASRP